jgi:hypothetical protein
MRWHIGYTGFNNTGILRSRLMQRQKNKRSGWLAYWGNTALLCGLNVILIKRWKSDGRRILSGLRLLGPVC